MIFKININKELKIFNEINIFQKYLKEQNNFCVNPKEYINKIFEANIILTKVKYFNKEFNLYVYKKKDIVSNYIISTKLWEPNETNNLLKALNYYSDKTGISNEEIYIIDIGANVGWYSFLLGKYGYKIISFEPSLLNYYILRKNYCINQESNIILINKGLYTEDKKCDLYNLKGNIGNGMIICDKNNSNISLLKNSYKTGEIELTKLSNYIYYLKNSLVLIKLDVEGSEGKVIEGGIELITQYHIPFIVLEFTPLSLRLHGTDPKEFLLTFLNNGYKISPFNFLDKKSYTADYLINIAQDLINLYITYSKILEK